MTTTLAITEIAQTLGINSALRDDPNEPINVDSTPTAGLYRYQLSRNIMINYPLQFTATLSELSGSGVFFILMLQSPTSVSALAPGGAMDVANIPSAYGAGGTAASFELARQTFTTNGSKTFDLDLALIMQVMGTSTSPTGAWNGSLLLWLCAPGTSFGTWIAPVLTAYNTIDRANRDSGRSQAPEGSRMDRCPVTGLMVSRQQMVLDGYRGIYVHPSAYDPPEPEPMEFGTYDDPNEGGG